MTPETQRLIAELREALDLGLQAWRTVPEVAQKFLAASHHVTALVAALAEMEKERDDAVAALAEERAGHER